MKKLLLLIVTGAFFIALNPCQAEIPHLINYQGMLSDDGGNPLDGTYDLNFKIYGSESGDDSLWWEYHSDVTVTDGLFNVILGSTNPIPDTTFDDTVRYFGITVGADPELSPRMRLTSIPYAYRALLADSAAVAGSVVGSAGGWVDDGSVVRLEDSTDRVGIGTSSPVAGLHLKGVGFPTSFMYLQSDEDQDAGLRFYEGEDVKWHIFNSSPDSGLRIYNSNATKTVFFADQITGNVGIGTTTPNDHLHVADHIRVGEDDSYPTVFGELKHDGGGTGFKINAHAGGGGWADIHFQTNAGTKMFIESGGNVGIGTTSPNSRLHVDGSVAVGCKYVDSDYTATSSDCVILTGGSYDVNIYLPNAASVPGRIYTVKQTWGGIDTIIDPYGSQTIDGASTYNLIAYKYWITFVSDGSNWWIIGKGS